MKIFSYNYNRKISIIKSFLKNINSWFRYKSIIYKLDCETSRVMIKINYKQNYIGLLKLNSNILC